PWQSQMVSWVGALLGGAAAALLYDTALARTEDWREEAGSVKLTYYGHATFLLEANGTSLLIAPFNDQAGYPFPDVRPAAVIVSHEHFDHNYVPVAKGWSKVTPGLRDGGRDRTQ